MSIDMDMDMDSGHGRGHGRGHEVRDGQGLVNFLVVLSPKYIFKARHLTFSSSSRHIFQVF